MRLAVGLLVAFAVAAGFMAEAMAQVAAGRRVALVVGNAAYIESPLPNPINDARAMAEALKQRGFTVILRENTSKLDLERAVADFGEQLQQGATGLFYYAGHGMQVNGRNFLIPVDARIPSEQRVRLEAVDVDLVLEQMKAARAAINLVILDACRNNPFEKRFRSAGGGGLAQINAPEGTLIAYATSPGSVAADGQGKHSLYTEELLKAMQAPGNKVEDVFKTVRIAVSRRSNGAQTPWEASSLTGDFYFVPPPPPPKPEPVVVAPPPPPPPPPVAAPAPVESGPNRAAMELAFWDSVKASTSPSELQAYLTQFPEGTFAPLARARIATLTAPPLPVTRAAPVPAAPATTLQPAVAAPSQQMAALPPANAPLKQSSFDGIYTTQVQSNRGNNTAVLTIKDLKITGRISEYLGMSATGRCSITGRLEPSGVIREMVMECLLGANSINGGRFVGRFAPDPATGKIVGQTKREAPGLDQNGSTNTWTQSDPASVAATQSGPQQMAALPPATGPLSAAAFDGTYASQVRLGNVKEETAVITIKDLRISGHIGSECTFGGQLESSGEIREFQANCTGSGRASGTVRYTGRFAPDPANGQIVGRTVMVTPGMPFNGMSNTWVRR